MRVECNASNRNKNEIRLKINYSLSDGGGDLNWYIKANFVLFDTFFFVVDWWCLQNLEANGTSEKSRNKSLVKSNLKYQNDNGQLITFVMRGWLSFATATVEQLLSIFVWSRSVFVQPLKLIKQVHTKATHSATQRLEHILLVFRGK